MTPMLRFVVALKCEAQPLISRYRLKPLEAVPFPTYGAPAVALVVSGIGKLAAAAATKHLRGLVDEDDSTEPLWINVGTAGHRDRPVGQALLGTKVTDVASGAHWELHPPTLELSAGPIATVDRAENLFDGDAAYDMEAAGFCSAAVPLVRRERVQCFKVISDNRLSRKRRLRAREVEELIRNRMPELTAVVGATFARIGAFR